MFKHIKEAINRRKAINVISEETRNTFEQINEQHRKLIDAQIEFQNRVQKTLEPFEEYFNSLENWLKEQDALQDSIIRAREAGVPEDRILHNMEEGEKFFCS